MDAKEQRTEDRSLWHTKLHQWKCRCIFKRHNKVWMYCTVSSGWCVHDPWSLWKFTSIRGFPCFLMTLKTNIKLIEYRTHFSPVNSKLRILLLNDTAEDEKKQRKKFKLKLRCVNQRRCLKCVSSPGDKLRRPLLFLLLLTGNISRNCTSAGWSDVFPNISSVCESDTSQDKVQWTV